MLTPNPKIHFPPYFLKFYQGFLILLTFLFSSTGWTATDCTQVTEIPQIECEALLDLYNSTDGPNWKINTNWNETNAPCDWYGVSCESGHVTRLQLETNDLNGTIPESLENLSQLEKLYLQRNQLSGSIPKSLGNLSQLDYLRLYDNQLSGPIPESLGNLSQLEKLYLQRNQLSGSIPESLGNLSQLKSLHLERNQLSGSIPESLGNFSQLNQFWLYNNQLCGEIPNTLISLGKMGSCRLKNNYLTVNPNSSELIAYLNQECPDWKKQNPPLTNCITDPHHTLTLQTTGEGTITAPTGLDDGIQCPTNCNEDYLTDSTITLTAQAANDFQFTQWNGDCTGTDPLLTLTITDNLTCTATFEPKPQETTQHQLHITSTGEGQGIVTLQINNDPPTHCHPNCTQLLPHHSQITLTAQADNSSSFVGFFGVGCSGYFTLTQNTTCTARFAKRSKHNLTVLSQGLGSGYISDDQDKLACGDQCTRAYFSGTRVVLTATPDLGSSLLGWSAACDSSTSEATVKIDRDLTCEVQFGIAGTPQLYVEPEMVAFAPTKTVSKRTITLFNQGNGGLRLAELTILDPLAFQISEDNCSHAMLIPNGNCTVTLAFEPPAEETYQTQLHIPSNDPNTPTLVELQGSGCSQQDQYQRNVVFHPYRLDFGIEAVGNLITRQQRVDMWSQGCGSLDIDTIALTGRHADEFALPEQNCYYGTWQERDYASCTLTVAFNPTSAGIKDVQPIITYTDPSLHMSPYRWTAQAVNEGEAQLELSATEYDFGTLTLGHEPPPPWQLTITNSGNINLELEQISITEDFKYTDYGCGLLPPNQHCQVTVAMVPTTLGTKSGYLTLLHDGITTTIPLLAEVTGPADCSPQQITIETSGLAAFWDDPNTWHRITADTPQPMASDVVRINPGHIIIGLPHIHVKALCIEAGGVLLSPDTQGTALEIQATDYVQNAGQILGLPGQSSTSETCTQPDSIGQTDCAMPGASVIIKVGSQFSHQDKRGDWWWYGEGGPILNLGEIKAGAGGDGRYYAAPGGDALVLGRNTTNQGLIQAGDGGNLTGTQAGQAGRGGLTQIWGKLGGPGHLYNQYGAQALAGNGGRCNPNASTPQTGNRGGNLWLVSLPDVHLSGGIHRAGYGSQDCQLAGQDGDVIIEPNWIDLSGPSTRVSGGNITLFGGADWILDLRNLSEQTFEATGEITLAVGPDGVIDLRDNQTTLFTANGPVKLFADSILIDEHLDLATLIEAPEIVVGPHQLLSDVSLTAPGAVFGQPQAQLSLLFTLANNGPQTETYTLTLTDHAGWPLALTTSSITAAGLTPVDTRVQVTLPETRGATNTVTLTATSQTDPTVMARAQVPITVSTQPPLIDAETLEEFLADNHLTPAVPLIENLVSQDSAVTEENQTSTLTEDRVSQDSTITEENQTWNLPNQDIVVTSEARIENEVNSETAATTEESDSIQVNGNQTTTTNLTTTTTTLLEQPPSSEIETDNTPMNPTVVDLSILESATQCPLDTHWIDWPCRNDEQILRDVTFGPNASIAGGSVAGTIDNQGWLSQIQVTEDAKVSGGFLTGKIVNQGMIMDFQFVGQELNGGTLAGVIENNSFIGGTLKDITLAKDSVVIGGVIAGQVSGACDYPARLEEVMVKSHSELSCLILGEGIHLQENVTLQSVQIAVSPPAINPIVPVLLPALETVALAQREQATSALSAGGISVNGQAFQSVANVTRSDWITVWGQIWSDPAHWNQAAEMVVYGRYAATHSEAVPVYFMLVRDETIGTPQVQSWTGELAQLMAFETVAALSPSHWLSIYDDFLELPAGQLELWFGYRVVPQTGTSILIQNRDGIEMMIGE